MHSKTVVGGQIAVLSLFIVLILWYHDLLAGQFEPIQKLLPIHHIPSPVNTSTEFQTEREKENPAPISGGGGGQGEDGQASPGATIVVREPPKVLRDTSRSNYVRAIFDPDDTEFPRLECPATDDAAMARYATVLKYESDESDLIRYFFALDLTQCIDLLSRLLGSIIETIHFLGPENCVLSVVEEAMGAEYVFRTSTVDPKAGERIVGLAALRNLALQPTLDDSRRYSEDETTVVFWNDVAACMEDILELAYQRSHLGADMTCAMDWTYVGRDPSFSDVWISRTMAGDTFFKMPEDGSWDFARNLFWNDVGSKSRWSSHLPFQVFSCWNGAVTFMANPILNRSVAFRASNPGECYQGEPELFCKDLWHKGYGKIATSPAVNLEYSDDRGKDLKALKGYTSKWVGPEQDEKSQIEWGESPPQQVKYMDVMEGTGWRSWNEKLM